jgi:hypothetical protein
LTEDLIEEQQEILSRFGSSSEAARARAELQGLPVKLGNFISLGQAHFHDGLFLSYCEYTDMQAFRAANPGCEFGDFIRWYSPNDWIVRNGHNDNDDEFQDIDDAHNEEAEIRHHSDAQTDISSGRLSRRMADPDNIWQRLWRAAPPESCAKQTPLFHAEKAAERALHDIETMSMTDVMSYLSSVAVPMALQLLARTPVVGQQEMKSIGQVSSMLRRQCRPNGMFDTEVASFRFLKCHCLVSFILLWCTVFGANL